MNPRNVFKRALHMFYRGDLGLPVIGMPDNRKDTLHYLKNLKKYPSVFQSS